MGFVQRENEKNLKVLVKKKKRFQAFDLSEILTTPPKSQCSENHDTCSTILFCEVPFWSILQHHLTPGTVSHWRPQALMITLVMPWYHQAPGRAGPSAQAIVLPGDTCSSSELPQYSSAFPGTEWAQHSKPALYRMEQGLLLWPGPHAPVNMLQKFHQKTATQSSSTPLRFIVPLLWASLCCPASLQLCSNNNNSKNLHSTYHVLSASLSYVLFIHDFISLYNNSRRQVLLLNLFHRGRKGGTEM